MQTEAKPQEKYKIIQEMTSRDNNELNISWLCDLAGVSRSGYYQWIRAAKEREINDERDREDFDRILNAYRFRGYDKGRRGIHMRLLHTGIVMNPKKVSRLMKKYNLFCPIRKANPNRRMAQALKTDAVADNIVNREFRKHGARKILLTDIPYIPYNNGRSRVYLSTIKDAFTKEILAYVPSKSLEVDFVLETVEQLLKRHGDELQTDAVMHSDQGSHYTSISFRKLLEDKALRQSMSRRGNCWDNAPKESFYGHMKDDIDLSQCKTFEDVCAVIHDYMDYYNKDRYQWDLAKLSPNQYYEYIMTGVYPLRGLVSEPILDKNSGAHNNPNPTSK
ncbi:MAG: IS3 family transposase [Firmicutes bacterium]|nr:IS3 family transposase [Bacillota bacterium]